MMFTPAPGSGAECRADKEILAHFQEEAPKLTATDKSFRAQLIRGATMAHRDWLFLDYMRLMMRQKWADYFQEIDVMLCPVVPVTAFFHDSSDFSRARYWSTEKPGPIMIPLAAWAGLTGVAYLPATVAPVGLAENGLPVGFR
ncbi:MAG: amidase family protein [Desulfobacterales bacterium]